MSAKGPSMGSLENLFERHNPMTFGETPIANLDPARKGVALAHMYIESVRESDPSTVTDVGASTLAQTLSEFRRGINFLDRHAMFTRVSTRYGDFARTISIRTKIEGDDLYDGLHSVIGDDERWAEHGVDRQQWAWARDRNAVLTTRQALQALRDAPRRIEVLKLLPQRDERDPNNVASAYPSISINSGYRLPTDTRRNGYTNRLILPDEIRSRQITPVLSARTRSKAEELVANLARNTFGEHDITAASLFGHRAIHTARAKGNNDSIASTNGAAANG